MTTPISNAQPTGERDLRALQGEVAALIMCVMQECGTK